MNLIAQLVLRVVLVISIIGAIEFYLVIKKHMVVTIPFAIGFVLLQIIVLLINILFCLWRNGIINI